MKNFSIGIQENWE